MAHPTRLLLLALAAGLTLLVAYVARGALLLIYISAVFAVVLSPAVDRVHRLAILGWRPGRGMAILLIVLGVALLLLVLLLLGLPPVIADFQQLMSQLPERLQQLRNRLRGVPFISQLDVQSLERYAGTLAGGLTGFVSDVAQVLVAAASGIILTAYLILDGRRVFSWALSLLPPATGDRLARTLARAAERMRNWLVGQAMLMLILGSASAAVFGLLGIRYFYLLAVFAGVANIIPLLGPIATVILAGLVAATDSLGKVIGVIVFYLAYQQVENAFLTPRIMKKQVELSSTAVLVALLLGGELAGVPGALVAVPTAVLASVLIDEYLVRKPEALAPARARRD